VDRALGSADLRGCGRSGPTLEVNQPDSLPMMLRQVVERRLTPAALRRRPSFDWGFARVPQ